MIKRPRLVLFVVILLIGLIYGIFAALSGFESSAISAFIGVLIGALVVEASRHWLAQEDRSHQMKMAALEERLRAHQSAYALWRRLIFSSDLDGSLDKKVSEAQEWWENNCLYLTEEARIAFLRVFHAANNLSVYRVIDADPDLIEKTTKELAAAGDIIVKGVALPSISDMETEKLKDSDDLAS